MPQVMGVDVEIMRATPLERVQNRTQEQIADFPVPQNMEDYAGITRAFPQERVRGRAGAPHQAGWFACYSSKACGVHW